MTTRGDEMLSMLDEQLKSDTGDGSQCATGPAGRLFDPAIDKIFIKTNMVKLLNKIVNCFKDNVDASIKFSPDGIMITSLHHSHTVLHTTQLGREMFTSFECDKIFHTWLNLQTFAKKTSLLEKHRSPSITFQLEEDDLVISCPPGVKVLLKAIDSELEFADVSKWNYNIATRLNSEEFCKMVTSMPDEFVIHFDVERRCLVFSGDEDLSRTELAMPIDAEIIEHVKKLPEFDSFRVKIKKKMMGAVMRGEKLARHLIVGFAPDCPLLVRYELNKSVDSRYPDSTVTMYVGTMHDDSDSDDNM